MNLYTRALALARSIIIEDSIKGPYLDVDEDYMAELVAAALELEEEEE